MQRGLLMALKQNQNECGCGKSVKTLSHVMKNGVLRIIGKNRVAHYFCKSCGQDWGVVSV